MAKLPTRFSATMTLFNFAPVMWFDQAVSCASACRRARVVAACDSERSV